MGKNLAEESPSTTPAGPPTLTTYADIPLDGTPGITGIFFADGYQPASTVDVILYFHGLPTPCGGKGSDTIRETWRNKYFPLRELTSAGSKKNVVLVAPSLDAGANSGDLMSDTKNGGDKYLKAVLAHINQRVKTDPFKYTGADITIGSLILAGHSGGGKTIVRLAEKITTATVCECWGLDSLYGFSDRWLRWANAANHKFTLIWTNMGATNTATFQFSVNKLVDGLKEKTRVIARTNVIVESGDKPKVFNQGTPNHCAVPQTYWKDLLARASCLTNK